jgi:predicted nucleotidyltransferase
MINTQTVRIRTIQEQEAFLTECEQMRIFELNNAIAILKNYFSDKPETNVWLFGSITQANQFAPNSDIDIAVENAKVDRTELYLELENIFDRQIDLIYLEKISFRHEIVTEGIKIQ